MENIQISRDPFARTTLVRRIATEYTIGTKTCAWCGNHRRTHKGYIAFLFQYGTEHDSIACRVNWHEGLFCSKSCHDSYHS